MERAWLTKSLKTPCFGGFPEAQISPEGPETTRTDRNADPEAPIHQPQEDRKTFKAIFGKIEINVLRLAWLHWIREPRAELCTFGWVTAPKSHEKNQNESLLSSQNRRPLFAKKAGILPDKS